MGKVISIKPDYRDVIIRVVQKLVALLFLVIILFGCNGNSSAKSAHFPNDTVKTVCLFIDERGGSLRLDYVVRVVRDSILTDRETLKGKLSRDTAFYVPALVPLHDSLGKEALDSAGKPKTQVGWLQTSPKLIVKDFNVNVDELMKNK